MEMTKEQCEVLQPLWKDREFKVGDFIWHENKKWIIYDIVIDRILISTELEIKSLPYLTNSTKRIILSADTKTMLEALPKEVNEDYLLDIYVGRASECWYCNYVSVLDQLPFYETSDKNIDIALYEMISYLLKQGLLEVKA